MTSDHHTFPAAAEPVGGDPPPEGPPAAGAAVEFALPLVVRIERAAPPARTDALQTAARAVLTLLSSPEATAPDGPWTATVRAWEAARVRKVVRRARGAQWRSAEGLPGRTVRGHTAQVRVFPPVPLDGWPRELARLQVSGTELDEPDPPAAPSPGTPVLWLNPRLDMSAGKAMAQVGHGAQVAWWALDETARADWRRRGFPLAVRTATVARWAELAGGDLPMVRDAGYTEIAPGSYTVVADHPALADGRR